MSECQRCGGRVKPPGRVCGKCKHARKRDSYLRRTYGITLAEYERIQAYQGGRCAICQRANGRTKALAVDHDHSLGDGREAVRGLLCGPCNKGVVGHLRDDPEAFERGKRYLLDPPARRVLSEGADIEDPGSS